MYDVDFYSMMGTAIIAYIIAMVIIFALCIVLIVANCKLFSKAGEAGWKAIIPYYNTYVMTQLAGTKTVWFVLYIVPCTMAIGSLVIMYDFLKSYGCSTGMAVLGIFFPYIVVPMVAFSSKYQYIGVGE